MTVVDDIAEKLIEAAYERFGRPPDPGGEYIATVTRESDVQAHFREVVKLPRSPRTQELWDHWRSMRKLNADASMVMEAGLAQLSKDAALPAEQRRVIEEIGAFEAWYQEVDTELIKQANEESMGAAGLLE